MANTFVKKQVKVDRKISLLELIQILEENQKHIIINFQHLQKNYQRTGVKRVEISKDKNGNVVLPWLRTQDIDNGEYVGMVSFNFSHNTATINMLITHPIKLVKVEDETPIIEVASLLVNDLHRFRNYTIVSDGKVNVNSLKVKISNKKTFDLLRKKGVIAAKIFDFRREYTIQLDNLPLVNLNHVYGSIDGLFEQLAAIKVLASIISAYLKDKSDIFVSKQLAELKKYYLSKKLYINFPTTNEYENISEALVNGLIDSRLSYKVDIGSQDIVNLNKLHSANKFLARMYEVYDIKTRETICKPAMSMAFQKNIGFRPKHLSSRIKITKVDELMKPIFDDFLGLDNNGIIADILAQVGADDLIQVLQKQRNGRSVNKEELITELFAAHSKLQEFAEQIYRERIFPLVFYIGATGFLPEQMSAKAMNAEEVTSKYPHLQLSKDEQAGKFFAVSNSIISVYGKKEYYSKSVPVVSSPLKEMAR